MSEYDDQHAWVCENILPVLPGADSIHVQRNFIRKTDHFLQEASCWIDEADFESDSVGNVRLDFSAIDAQVAWIHEVSHQFRPLSHVARILPSFRDTKASFPHRYTNTPYPDVIVVWPRPNVGTTFTVTARCALVMNECTDDDVAIPDWVFSRYKEAIRAGVMGDMMLEPGKPYTQMALGAGHKASYKYWIAKARDESRRGFGHHESEWAYPQNFA